ncbi:thiamine phosphate synthase [Flexivirga sp. B27]
MPADVADSSHRVSPPVTSTRTERLERLSRARLYVCTDARPPAGDLAQFSRELLAGGVDALQVRDKQLESRAEIEALSRVQEETRRAGALLAVNDRADVAALVDADILHVGQGDLTTGQARRIVGQETLIGRSTHSKDQLLEADSDAGIDYFCVGPVWETPTKPGRAAVGLELIRFAAQHATKPWFAIGGIDREDRLREVVSAGATRIVVVRAVRETPRESAAALRALLP